MLKFNRVLLGACCFVFPVLFYSASQLKQSCPVEEVQWDAGTSWEEYEGHLAWSMRTPPQDKSSKLEQTANDTRVKASSKPTQSAKSKRPNLGSKAKQLAYETAIKLQYALDSTDANFEDPHLFTMGQYMNSLTIYLKLMLSNESVDQEPFHNLRQRLFPWWFPSSYAAYLPWDPHDRPETGIVVTVGNGNFVLAAHLIRTLRNVVNSSLPIEIYYAGDSDLPEDKREEIKALGPSLVTINIHDQFNESIAGIQNSGFAMKPFAALASSFERVILVDADTIFLQRPDGYFNEHAGLRETGLYYFHDRTIQIRTTTDWVKTLMHGREPSTTLSESIYWQQELDHQQESGVVFYNKAIPSAFISLLFTTYMNTLKVRSEVYQHVWGTLFLWPPSILPKLRGQFGKGDVLTSLQAIKKPTGLPPNSARPLTPSPPITPALSATSPPTRPPRPRTRAWRCAALSPSTSITTASPSGSTPASASKKWSTAGSTSTSPTTCPAAAAPPRTRSSHGGF